MYYYILDTNNQLEPVGIIRLSDILEEMNVPQWKFEQMLNRDSFRFRNQYILVETKFKQEKIRKKETEKFQLLEESKQYLWYVSNFGKVYTKQKNKEELKEIKPRLRKGVVEIQYHRHTVNLKNLVAKYFLPEWSEKCIVRYKDSQNLFDCSSKNLYIECTRKEFAQKLQTKRVCIPVVQYIQGIKVKQWNSISDAAKELHYSKSTISERLKEGKNQFDGFELYYLGKKE